ncbi:MAG: hypothetical protein CMO01_00600 [Thalassobius sp.]|nr:hypothetical protein [Thalassovita sp.]
MLIRKILIKLLGFQNYLAFISYVFLKTYTSKFYLGEHKQVRFLKNLVKPGDVCIDIGANLGYFSIPLSRYIGKQGKLYSVEPVAAFREHLNKNIKKFAVGNVEVMPYALGEDDNKKIKMITPEVEGVIRHGRTEVQESTTNSNVAFEHETLMMRPQSLFGSLENISFIKCDVEGYELHILPLFKEIIENQQPILEIEIDPLENKREIINMLNGLNYQVYFLGDEKLMSFDIDNSAHQKEIELYFLPKNKINHYQSIIASN